MNFRTDLALECHEYAAKKHIEGVTVEKKSVDEVRITTITVENEKGERALGKPKGRYITLEIAPLTKNSDLFSAPLTVLCDEIRRLIPEKGSVLVAGLGNDKITPDALGPRCVSFLLATRHLDKEFAKSIGFERLRSVSALVPGVLGQTGIETAEIIRGVVSNTKPDAVIVVDALASRNTHRLGATVQMTDTGVSPGSGVGNRRSEISRKTLGVPVIAIGVPTVVDGATLAMDLIERAGVSQDVRGRIDSVMKNAAMMVTPKEIDNMIDRAARLVAMGINTALQPDIPAEDILAIVS